MAVLPPPTHLDLATLLARGLVALDREDLEEGNLTLELGVTLWMSRAGAGLGAVRATLVELRGALVAASGLDARSEPVPLGAADDRLEVRTLAVYLHHLLERAANRRRCSRAEMAEGALALLGL